MKNYWFILGIILSVFLSGCASTSYHPSKHIFQKKRKGTSKPYKIRGAWYYPQHHYEYTQEGYASWYGPGFHGKSTATGDTFDMNQISAAHRTLPIPCMVRVTNLDNGRVLDIVVNDRGPFIDPHKRLIDISRKGAQLLGFFDKGVAKVRIECMVLASVALGQKRRRHGSDQAALQLAAQQPIHDKIGQVSEATQKAHLRLSEKKESTIKVKISSIKNHLIVRPQNSKKYIATAENYQNPHDLLYASSSQQPAVVMPKIISSATVVKNIYIHFGTFKNKYAAQKIQDNLKKYALTTLKTQTRSHQRLYSVYVGPCRSSQHAKQLLEKIRHFCHAEGNIIKE